MKKISAEIAEYLISSPDNLSIDGMALDPELVNFELKCIGNKEKYYKKFPNVLRYVYFSVF